MLLPEIARMTALGIDVLRISPQSAHTGEVIAAFAAARDGAPVAAPDAGWSPEGFCDGYWHGRAGIESTQATSC